MQTTKTFILALVLQCAVWSQTATPTLTLAGPTAVSPGVSPVLTLSLANSAGANLSAIAWEIGMPAGVTISSSGATATPTMAALGKSALCGAGGTVQCSIFSPGGSAAVGNCAADACILMGLANGVISNNPIAADGVIATIPLSIASTVAPGPMQFSVYNAMAADVGGNMVTMAPTYPGGGPIAVNLLSKCDVNGDGTVNAADVMLVLSAYLNAQTNPNSAGSCPLAGGCTFQALDAVYQAANGNACTL